MIAILEPGVLAQLSYPKSRSKTREDNIEDIYDDKRYRSVFGSNGYFIGTAEKKNQKEIHLSLQVNTDGVSIFKSSQHSICAIYFTINELPSK